MSSPWPRNSYDPYAGNILVQGLGPILDRRQAGQQLLYLPPPVPHDISAIPKHYRMHFLMALWDLHIPSAEGSDIHESIDILVRQGYRHRDPGMAAAWRQINGHPPQKNPLSSAMASVVVGHSGTGKTRAVQRSLQCYPQQIILHNNFPQIKGPHAQMVWLSVNIPPSGRRDDLATNLMNAWDDAMSVIDPGIERRFRATLSKAQRKGAAMLDEWSQVARSHFLGVLHLDEVQNLFRLLSLKHRRRKKGEKYEAPELAVAEDECLRWILTLLNTWNIPVVFSGTPDGIGALTRRMSTAERISAGGYHKLDHFVDIDNKGFSVLFKVLLKHQYVKVPLEDSEQFRELLLELTAGIPRIIISLWIAAHRVSFKRKEDSLKLADFKKAAKTYLSPVAPAVAALRSGNPELMNRYEDLIPRDDAVWSSLWGG